MSKLIVLMRRHGPVGSHGTFQRSRRRVSSHGARSCRPIGKHSLDFAVDDRRHCAALIAQQEHGCFGFVVLNYNVCVATFDPAYEANIETARQDAIDTVDGRVSPGPPIQIFSKVVGTERFAGSAELGKDCLSKRRQRGAVRHECRIGMMAERLPVMAFRHILPKWACGKLVCQMFHIAHHSP